VKKLLFRGPSGVLVLRAFSFWDYFHRLAFTLIYLGFRNPYRPTMKEWFWSIPANIFYNIPLPAIQFWSFLTVLHDSWGTTMRTKKKISSHSKLRLNMGGWLLRLMDGTLGRSCGEICRQHFNAGLSHLALFIFLGVVPLRIIYGWWMVVAE